MTDKIPGGRLRAAADSIDDARTDLEYGDLDVPPAIQTHVEQVDATLEDLDEMLRELAMLDELAEKEGVDLTDTIEDHE